MRVEYFAPVGMARAEPPLGTAGRKHDAPVEAGVAVPRPFTRSPVFRPSPA